MRSFSTTVRSIILSSALLLIYSSAAFAQPTVLGITTSYVNTIQSFSTATSNGAGTTLNTGSTVIFSAAGATLGADKFVYLTDGGSGKIYKIDPINGGTAVTFADLSAPTATPTPTGIAFSGNYVYMANFVGYNPGTANGAGTVDRYTITNGNVDVNSKLSVVTGLTQPAGITVVPTGLPNPGQLLISNTGYTSQYTPPYIPDGRVVKYDPFTGANGTVNQNFIAQGSNPTAADPVGLKGPSATRYLPNGDLLVADAVDTGHVRRYSSTGGNLGIFTDVNISSPSDILVVTSDTVNRSGSITTETTVWIANLNDNAGNGWISRYDLNGGFIDFRAAPGTGSYAVLVGVPAPVPEPATVLGAASAFGMLMLRWKRRGKPANPETVAS